MAPNLRQLPELKLKTLSFLCHLGPTWAKTASHEVPRVPFIGATKLPRANIIQKKSPKIFTRPQGLPKTFSSYHLAVQRNALATQVSQDLLEPGIAYKLPFLDFKGEASKAGHQEAPKKAQETSKRLQKDSNRGLQ